jgi:HEAT repeat protein
MIHRAVRLLLGVVAGMGLLALGVWILIHRLGDRDYLYQGHAFEYWQDRMSSSDPAISNETRLVIEGEILPHLRGVMLHDTRDSALRLALVERLNDLPGVTLYVVPAPGRRALAAAGLGALGARAELAIPELVQIIRGTDEPVRAAAVSALGHIHCQPEKVIPLLISSIDDPQDGIREAAVEALGDFGSLSRSAWPKLVALRPIRDKDLQHALGIALKRIDPDEAAKLGLK